MTPRVFVLWAFTRSAHGRPVFKWRGFGFHRLPQSRPWRLHLGRLILGRNA